MSNIPKIIGLTGIIGSGKDTFSSMLIEEYGYKQVSFAEPLKDALSAIFGWPRELLEGKTEESRLFRETKDLFWSEKLGFELTPRIALQNVGTDLFRKHFHNDIWVLSITKRIQDLYNNENIIFSDCRFVNEINAVKMNGGLIIEVQPKTLPQWYYEALKDKSNMIVHGIHESEYQWIGENDPWKVVQNCGTLDDLKHKAKQIFQS